MLAGSGRLDRLAGIAKDYARSAAAENTLKAYTAVWAHYARWCQIKGPAPPRPS